MDVCGHPTKYADTSVCQNPATEGDSCWIPAHGGSAENHGNPGSDRLTKELVDNVCRTIAEGKSVTSAVRMEGLPVSVWFNWLQQYEGPEPPDDVDFDEEPYAYLAERYVRARGLGEDFYAASIIEMAEEAEDVATLISLMKQRYPESWAKLDRGSQTGRGVVVNVTEAEEFEVEEDTLRVKKPD